MSSSGRAAGSGGPLAIVQYTPGVTASPSTSATAFSDIDAVHLIMLFTVPANGKVLVRLTGWVTIPVNAGGSTTMRWNLRDAGGDIAGTDRAIVENNSTTLQTDETCSVDILVTGLTPGQALSWKWGWASSVAAHTVQMAIGAFGGTFGNTPTIMEAWNAV